MVGVDREEGLIVTRIVGVRVSANTYNIPLKVSGLLATTVTFTLLLLDF